MEKSPFLKVNNSLLELEKDYRIETQSIKRYRTKN